MLKEIRIDNHFEKVTINDFRFDIVYLSFSTLSPYYALINNVKFSNDSNGKVLIDNGFNMGTRDNRFCSMLVKDGLVDRNSVELVQLSKDDVVRISANKLFANYLGALEYSGFNSVQLKLLSAGISI